MQVWTALGVGLGGARGTGGLADIGAMGEIVVQKQPHHVALRALVIADVGTSSSDDEVGELGVMYGRTATSLIGHMTIASGLAFTGGDLCPSNSACDDNWTVGIPIVAELALRPFPILGLGIQAFANLNTKGHYFGGVLFLQLGWMP